MSGLAAAYIGSSETSCYEGRNFKTTSLWSRYYGSFSIQKALHEHWSAAHSTRALRATCSCSEIRSRQYAWPQYSSLKMSPEDLITVKQTHVAFNLALLGLLDGLKLVNSKNVLHSFTNIFCCNDSDNLTTWTEVNRSYSLPSLPQRGTGPSVYPSPNHSLQWEVTQLSRMIVVMYSLHVGIYT